MSGVAFRLWVLLLAVLLQLGGWRSEVASPAWEAGSPPPALGDREASEDLSGEVTAVDDSAGNDVLLGGLAKWLRPPCASCWQRGSEGLPPGGPPSDAPFKPPRA